jgi:transcription elongation factor Elf1
MDELFGLLHQSRDGDTIQFYNCPSCEGELCVDCIIRKRGFFSTKYYCAKCGIQIRPEIGP